MNSVYLDNAATTRVDDDIAKEAARVMCEEYGNPSSLHGLGVSAERLVKTAQNRILGALKARGGSVIFTGGGTESDNIALFGAFNKRKGRGNHIITTAIEHSAVLESMRELERQGAELTILEPSSSGAVSVEAVANACRSDTVLLSVMAVCNETGAIHDIAAMSKALRERSPHALFHTDAVQAFGKIPFSVSDWGVDMLSLSGHKIHAPKGIGALYIADRVNIAPSVFGGGQQMGLRPGTENVPSIHALGLAAQKAADTMRESTEKAMLLRQRLLDGITGLGGATINSPPEASPFILNISLTGYRSEVLLHFLESRGIYVSSGSACGRGKASHVLIAMKLGRALVDSSLRMSFSHYTTESDVDALLDALSEAKERIIKSR